MQPAEVNFKRNAAVLVATLSVDKLVAFLTFVFFANYFSPGTFGIAYAVIGISVAALGFPKAVNVSVKKRISEDTRRRDAVFLLGMGVTIAFAVVVGAIALAVTTVFTIRHQQFVEAGILHLFSRSFLHLVKTTHEGLGETGTSGVLEMIDGITTSLLRFVFILGMGLGVGGLIYGPVVSALLVGTVSAVSLIGVPGSLPNRDLVDDFVRFSFWTVVARGIYTMYNNVQVALPGFIVNATATSFMKTAKNLSEPAGIVQSAVLKNTFVGVSSLDTRGQDVGATVRTSLKYADLVAFPLVGGALVLSEDVMTVIYGSAYAGTGIVLLAVTAAFLFNVHVNALTSSLHALNRPRTVALSNGIVSVVFVPVIVGLLFVYDSVFAILPAIVVAPAFEAGMLYYLVRRATDTRILPLRSIGEKLFTTGVMVGVVAVLGTKFDTGTPVGLSAVVLFGAIVYFAVLIALDSEIRRTVFEYV